MHKISLKIYLSNDQESFIIVLDDIDGGHGLSI